MTHNEMMREIELAAKTHELGSGIGGKEHVKITIETPDARSVVLINGETISTISMGKP